MNDRKRAVALQYRDREDLPRVLSIDAGELAERLVALAKERGIPVQENEELVDLLSKLDAGAVISPDTFRLVAEIISFLYHCDKEWRESHPFVEGIVAPEAAAEPTEAGD